MEVDMAVNEGIFYAKNHMAVVFKENTHLNLSREAVGDSLAISKNRSLQLMAEGVDSKLSAQKKADLISSELDGQVIKNLPKEERERLDNGCPNVKFLRIFREYNTEYKLDIVSLLKLRVSEAKADVIIANLSLKKSHRVEAIGFFGGFKGPPFTWHRGNLFERLDQALGNEA
ncbi:hypothetical protein Gohar_004287 [Gossypium harknessii]|uniref:Uncharacterized protein n=1 Tax=Gossypium harknessii TaxID=34285 RepID=A0A7J9H4G9_9ROSI|nr:hypothetical protein [Gossypium harknessii]